MPSAGMMAEDCIHNKIFKKKENSKLGQLKTKPHLKKKKSPKAAFQVEAILGS